MVKHHHYRLALEWPDEAGQATQNYTSYSRNHRIRAPGKPDLQASSDPAFRGDKSRYNPDELLVAALSSCHMLWYLHLCADAGIAVTHYRDEPEGVVAEEADGGGYFVRVTLRPQVRLARGDAVKAKDLHREAHRLCFIARSVRFPLDCEPVIAAAP